MPIRPFREVPKNLVEWSRFFQQTEVTPTDGSVGEGQLGDGQVTFRKIQNVTPDRLLGRDTSPAGQVQELEVTGGLEFTGSGIRRSALTGDIVADAGSNETTFREFSALSVLGRSPNTVGAAAEIVAASNGHYLRRASNVLEFGAIADSDLPATIARDSEVTAAIAALNLASGTYTPTLNNMTNLDATVAYACQYLRVGSVVTVSGRLDANPTAAGTTQIGISLPIASNFAGTEECAGTAFSQSVAGLGAAILADTADNRALMEWTAVDTIERSLFFSFTYRII
jgi:hypothetical protein